MDEKQTYVSDAVPEIPDDLLNNHSRLVERNIHHSNSIHANPPLIRRDADVPSEQAVTSSNQAYEGIELMQELSHEPRKIHITHQESDMQPISTSENDNSSFSSQDPESSSNTTTEKVQQPSSSSKSALNKYALYTLVAGLIISALISVTAVLIGEFTSTMGRALGTTFSMVSHTLLALALLTVATSRGSRNSILVNVLFSITIASFITSIMGIWGVIDSQMSGDLYTLYFYTVLMTLWLQLLRLISGNRQDKATYITALVAMTLSGVFYCLIIPSIFTNYPNTLPEFYYRAVAATVILLATASVLTTVFRRIYVFKHPEAKQDATIKSGWDIVAAFIVLFIGLPIIAGLLSTIANYSDEKLNTNASYTRQLEQEETEKHYEASTTTSGAFVSCQTLPEFKNPAMIQRVSAYIFVSHDGPEKRIFVTEADGVKSENMSYSQKLIFFDAYCKEITSDRVRSGDTVMLYHKADSGLTNNSLMAIQKIN